MLHKKLLYLLVPVAFYLLLNIVFNHFFYYDNFGKINYTHNLFPEHNEIFDVVVTGNSQPARAIDFALIDSLNGLNVAMGSQSVDFDYEMLNAFEDNFTEKTIVLLTLTFFSFCDQFSGSNRRYDPFFETDRSLTDRIIESYFPLVGFERTSTSIRNTLNYILDDQNLDVDDTRLYPYSYDISLWEIDGLRRYEGHKSRALCDEELFNNHWQLIEKIITTNQEKGRQVYILTVPYHYTYFDNLINDEQMNALFYERIELLTMQFNIQHLDYSKDERFYNNINYFRDWDHMNSYGAEKFTKILIDDLLKLSPE